MTQSIISAIEQRVSTDHFDDSRGLADVRIRELVALATRAPSAFNLQNWRFIAVRTPAAKARLCKVANNQPKVATAAVTFIVVGQLPMHTTVVERLRPSVDAGFMPHAVMHSWEAAVRDMYAHDLRMQRDEAIRSATLGAATLMFAATAFGLASGPMVGFDPEGVTRAFHLKSDEVPVMLLAMGYAGPGNWPQKPRRPVAEVLDFA